MRAVVVFIAIFLITPAQAATIYVNTAATGADNGSSWTNAYTDLQDALAIAVSGDEIWVAAGTYKPTLGTDQSATFTLSSGIAVYGGFDGSETSLGERDHVTNVTVLSGEIGDPGTLGNTNNVVTISGVGNNAVLDGFTVRDGHYPFSGTGAGIYHYRASATLRNLIVRNNHAWSGGGIYNYAGNPTIENTTIELNTAEHRGGGMFIDNIGVSTFTNVTITLNDAADEGAGMYNYRADLNMTDVVFDNNTTVTGYGGLYTLQCGALNFSNVTFAGHRYGLTIDDCNPTIENTLFSGNERAGLLLLDANTTIRDCQFVGNDRGIYVLGVTPGDALVERSLFDGNGSKTRAMEMAGGSHTVVSSAFVNHHPTEFNSFVVRLYGNVNGDFINCTFAGNSDEGTLNGLNILSNSTASGNLNIYNSIIWNPQVDNSQMVGHASISHSLIRNSGGSGGWALASAFVNLGGNIDANPNLIDAVGGNVDPASITSPVINAGTATAPGLPTSDYHGNARVIGPAPDIGAVEFDYAVGVISPTEPLGLGKPYPNPFNPAVTIPLRGTSLSARVDVFDAKGRWITNLKAAGAAMPDALTWQGRNHRGEPVASGVYFIRASDGPRQVTQKITLLK